MHSFVNLSRRQFLTRAAQTTAGLFAASAWPLGGASKPTGRLKVAAIVTEFTYRSHGHVILKTSLNLISSMANGQIRAWT